MKKVSKEQYYIEFANNNLYYLIVGYCKWLKQETANDNIEKIFFLSRDGYLIKTVYDKLYPNDKTSYLLVSRKSTTIPALSDIENIEEIFGIVRFPSVFTIDYLFKKIGLNDEDISTIAKEIDVKKDISKEYVVKSKEINNIFKKYKKTIRARAKQAKQNISKYLNIKGFNGKVAIVDMGWYGSIQIALEKISNNASIHGYYFGIDPKTPLNKEKAKGYLMGHDTDKRIRNNIYEIKAPLEFLVLERNGSVTGYDKNGTPIRSKYEYKNTESENVSRIIQEQISKIKIESIEMDEIDPFTNLRPLLQPRMKDAEAFGDILYEDSGIHYMAKPEYGKLIAGYKQSSWKIGYLKRALKIIAPYKSICATVRSIYEK